MRIALALILVAGFAATANADVYTWFTTTADETEAAALKGTDLDIVYNPCPGGQETIHVYQWISVEGVDLNGYDCDLAYGDDTGFFSIDSLTATVPTMWFPAAGAGDATGWSGYGGADIMGMATMGDGLYQIADFDLTINHTGMPETHSILAGIGANEWSAFSGMLFGVIFGDDTTAISAVDTTTFSEVITVTCVPEPTTLALLGFGALALIRRR